MENVIAVDGNAEKVCGNKPGLRGAHPNHADDEAVDAGHNPALPLAPANQNCGCNGQQTGNVIKPQHQSPVLRLIL
jgi:hypothetical protein